MRVPKGGLRGGPGGAEPPLARRTRIRALTALLAALSLIPACGGNDSSRLSIATGGTGGVYFVLGGGLAAMITKSLDGVEATAEVTAGSVDNLLLLAAGDTDIAFSLADTAADAVGGKEAFKQPLDLRALARLYTNFTQVVTSAGADIKTVADLAGKRVSVGSPNSGTEVIANRILAAAGINVRREQLGIGESVSALRDGIIDAFFWSGGLPTGSITDLASTDRIRLLPLDGVLPTLRQQFGDVYQAVTIPAGTYGVPDDVASVGVANYLVVQPGMETDLAERITRLLFEQHDQLVTVHPEAKNIRRDSAGQVAPLQLHPGAARYFETTTGSP